MQQKPEVVVDIADKWKKLNHVKDASSSLDTQKRINLPASNVDRNPEEGCMKKIKIERSLKLRKEDFRNRTFNVVTNNQEPENTWIDSFQGQKETFYDKFMPQINPIHDEKKLLATAVTNDDLANEKLRVNMNYKPKMNITHSSSIRYKFTPVDNKIF